VASLRWILSRISLTGQTNQGRKGRPTTKCRPKKLDCPHVFDLEELHGELEVHSLEAHSSKFPLKKEEERKKERKKEEKEKKRRSWLTSKKKRTTDFDQPTISPVNCELELSSSRTPSLPHHPTHPHPPTSH